MITNRFNNKDDKQNLLLIIVSAILFYGNEVMKLKIKIPYIGYLLKNHYNDFLGGISFIALVNVILLFSKYNKIKKLKHILIIGLICSIAWELVTPVFVSESIGDFWDVISYGLGFTLYWIIKRYISKDITYKF